MKKMRKQLFFSLVSLMLCFSMLLGTTYAWFTDSATSVNNIIKSGNLDIAMYWAKDLSGNWTNVEDTPEIFNYDKWEPGYTEVRQVKIVNEGDLAFKYAMRILPMGEVSILANVIDVYFLDPAVEITDRAQLTTPVGTLAQVIAGQFPALGKLENKDDSATVTVALKMREDAGNEYQGLSIGDSFSIQLTATQLAYENDAFDETYDGSAVIPSINQTASVPVEPDANNLVPTSLTLVGAGISATVPAGTKVDEGTDKMTLSVSDLEQSRANVETSDSEIASSLDVHVEGVAADNTAPIAITIEEYLPTGLNIGNYRLYHVENGNTVEMTLRAEGATPVHNNFDYDPVTGDVVLYMATFSEVMLVADTVNAWEGNFDYSWYTGAVTLAEGDPDYTIANADQLAALSAIVGGMNDQTQDSFGGKTIKLLADINLGDKESENNPDLIFYPIGYYNSEGTYEKTNTAITSGLRNFEGTFDGNGNTISNFYQNTWEMKGDHNWYDATLQYYRDGMGLFGKVYGGTVKNLTVANFSSDGEIATTGVVAAYADGATFENIAITGCNPRVYNIGNGGIVGCVGWYAKEANLKTTFTNITVDNSNKISALWGSYDVACGGIVGQYYPTSGQDSAPKNAGIDMVNCHVSAVMDVYNDVCGNYQYYAYRYAGMMIGSIRENTTNKDGKTIPDMTGISATGCTVHFGTWNDYYYCEIIDNTTASYTHDYQMSRLVEIRAIDMENKTVTTLDGESVAIPTSGRANYVIVDYSKGHGTENATCYHFKDGEVWTHDMGGIQTGVDENGDGEDDLKEDKQHIYLEFNNLFTGYGWGVSSMAINKWNGITALDVTTGDHEKSVVKFVGKVTELVNKKEYKLGDIFSFVGNNGVALVPSALTVSIVNKDELNPVSATVAYDRDNWENGTISFTGAGEITITIQDYYFCTPTSIGVTVNERQPEEKFDVVMNNGDFLHRVGNSGTVALEKLFKTKDGVEVGTVSVTVEAVDGTGASGTYSNNAIQFSGTGVVKVTITDNNYCIPTTLYLEVVDATNATSATDAKDKDVVLLNNIGSGFTVDNGHTVYGNGFTLTYADNGRYLNNGLKQGVVMVQNGGSLDNLRIKASIYPTAFMYYGTTQLGDYVQQDTNPSEVEGTKTRYYYQLSAVATYGDATISNCYIYGGRTNIYANTGNVKIVDTILECGVVANVQIQSTNEYTVTLENLTTIQYRVNATIDDTSKVMLGAGVLVGPETTSNPTILLNGNLKQYNWVDADDKNAVSGTMAQMIIGGALDATAYNHTVNGKTASNLGIIFMNEEEIDLENNTGLPYKEDTVTMSLNNSGSIKGKVYSVQNATANQIYSDYVNADRSTVNGDYLPRFEFDLGDQEISYDGSEDTRYLYGDKNGVTALYQDGYDALTLDLTKLATVYKYDGKSYDVTAVCKDSAGNALSATDGVVTLSALGSYTLEFTANDNIFYNHKGETITKSVTRTYTVPLTLTVKEANVKNAEVNITKTALDGVYTTVNLTDYKLRVNFLDCISVTDYDNAGTGTTVDLTSNISSATLTPASVNVFTTASTVTITYTDGRVLTVNLSKISGSSAGTKTATVNTSGDLYFITEGALNNKPTASADQNKCTITSVSYKGNSGSTVTNDTDVTVTWELGSSDNGSCFTGDTLITLADGTQKRMDEIVETDLVRVFNHETGAYEAMPLLYYVNDGVAEYNVINLVFSDGTVARLIYEHALFDMTLNKYVYIREDNFSDFVGHKFAKDDCEGEFIAITLEDAYITEETVGCYSITSLYHLNYYVDGMLSLPGAIDGLFNYFEYDCETLTYDVEKMEADIGAYGLYTYEDFADYATEEMFDTILPAKYLKVAVGKGLITFEGILELFYMYLV